MTHQADHHGRRHGRRLPVRGHPRRISVIPSGKNSASVFINQPRDRRPCRSRTSANGPTGRQLAERLRQRPGEQASEIRRGGGVPSGAPRRPEQRQLPAFLLQLPGHEPERLQPADPVHQRRGHQTRINRTGTAWPATEGADSAREIGVVVAYDVNASAYKTIWGMGRLNHENNVAVPGYGKPVLLSGDDAFVSNPAQSQVYALHREQCRRGVERRGRPVGLRVRQPGHQRLSTTSGSAPRPA